MLKQVGNFLSTGELVVNSLRPLSSAALLTWVSVYRIGSQVSSILCQGFVNW